MTWLHANVQRTCLCFNLFTYWPKSVQIFDAIYHILIFTLKGKRQYWVKYCFGTVLATLDEVLFLVLDKQYYLKKQTDTQIPHNDRVTLFLSNPHPPNRVGHKYVFHKSNYNISILEIEESGITMREVSQLLRVACFHCKGAEHFMDTSIFWKHALRMYTKTNLYPSHQHCSGSHRGFWVHYNCSC